MPLDLVVLGNLIVDDIVYEDGRTRMAQPGGATLYMGLTAPLWGLRIGLVSIAGSDFPLRMLEELDQRQVDLAGVRRTEHPGLRTWLLHEGGLRRVVHRLEGATHAQASPGATDIPDQWQPRAIHLAPMPFDLQHRLATDLTSRFGDKIMLSLDPFELLTADRPYLWRGLLSQFDLFFVSDDEMAASEIRQDPEAFLQTLFSGRLGLVLFKRGDQGGLALRPAGAPASSWPARAADVVDTTGAGDAFACGVLAGLIRGQDLERALQWGVVSASFAIQDQGVEGLLDATPAAARQRLESWFGP